MTERVYVVTDIEVDGFVPGASSMLSFASVAVTASGKPVGEFEAVLEPLPGAEADPDVMAFFHSQPPEVLAAATADPRPVPEVMADFVSWVRGLGEAREFVSSPLGFDGMYVDHYLRRFTPYAVCQGMYDTDRLFHGPGLCLKSLACGVTGGDWATFSVHDLPSEWFGDVPHTHRAIDDARGYANLLVEVLRRSRRPA
ncbi:hypothetical protein [Nocardioides astragali]|uniref:Exonuclease n=1 Tax=Nocardioides astragali TaxID=1776736 RepID=A0ABW2N6L8_9ACTN|nr:hypothetical protein [Nocardioides astragali]